MNSSDEKVLAARSVDHFQFGTLKEQPLWNNTKKLGVFKQGKTNTIAA